MTPLQAFRGFIERPELFSYNFFTGGFNPNADNSFAEYFGFGGLSSATGVSCYRFLPSCFLLLLNKLLKKVHSNASATWENLKPILVTLSVKTTHKYRDYSCTK
jgi:hypothetical protein